MACSRETRVLVLELFAQHAGGVVAAVGPDVRCARGQAHRFLVVGLGQQMGALEPLQLEPVFEQSQEFVRRSGLPRLRGRCRETAFARAAGASTVDATCRDSSRRPWTSCSSCTANSTSRNPPVPSLSSRPRTSAGTSCSTRRRMACTSTTKSSRSQAVHTIGINASGSAARVRRRRRPRGPS